MRSAYVICYDFRQKDPLKTFGLHRILYNTGQRAGHLSKCHTPNR